MKAKSSLKIGFVLDDGLDKPDGVQQYILTLGAWMRTQGHEVHYIVGETQRHDLPGVHSMSKNVRVNFNGNSLTIPLPASRRRLRALLQEHHFDVLHIQVPYSPFMAQRLLKLAPADTVVYGTFHIAPNSWIVTAGSFLLGLWLRPTLRRFDKMVSVSTAAASLAKTTFRVRTDIMPNVIDYHKFHIAEPLPQYRNKVPTILFLGRLVPRKGVMLLLRAVKKLHDHEPTRRFRLVICGRGPLQSTIEAYVSKHELQDVVELTGFVSESDKPRYYASADLAVFPSTGGESFGIVLLEAMASGRAAVLAGDNPGYRSVMEPLPALLFNPGRSTQTAELLATYLDDKKLRRQAAGWGEAYSARFDVGTVGQELLEDYRTLLRNRHKN